MLFRLQFSSFSVFLLISDVDVASHRIAKRRVSLSFCMCVSAASALSAVASVSLCLSVAVSVSVCVSGCLYIETTF